MAEYNPAEIERKWQKYWEDNKVFEISGKPGAKKFYCLDMFPYPSGAGLHIGHPLGYTATDIYSRFKRMNGFSVLHPMGFDAFGLPAEQHAIATGEHPGLITENNCGRFTEQMKRIGFSYDWSRSFATCTPDYYKWTQWIFLKLYNSWFDRDAQKARPISELPIPSEVKAKGDKAVWDYQADRRLAFYTDAMVNWCPALGTVLSNEEVIDGKSERGGHDVIRRPMKQWMLRITEYAERLLKELDDISWPDAIKEQQRNWIGKKHGTEIDFIVEATGNTITCFTTRPDTLFGVTFFVVSPEHPVVQQVTTSEQAPKVKKYCDDAGRLSEFTRTLDNREKTGVFTGAYVINPVNNEKVPLYAGDYVLMSYGTGAVMGVPAHDDRDFEFARKFNIEIRPVIAPAAGEPEVKQAIIDGELCWIPEGVMLPCVGPVAKELKLEGRPSREAWELITEWLVQHDGGRRVVNYKLRDWLFSRQRYWGEPIPVIHWEDGTHTPLDETELPLLLPDVQDFAPTGTGESPLAKAEEWVNVVDPKTGRSGQRETNTMPNWAGSCWYYLRFIDPHNEKEGWDPELEKAWMPVDLYVGGAEHAVLHLLYSRFWHKVLYDLGYVSTREPFQRLFNQGMIQSFAYKDSRGALVPVNEVEEDEKGNAVHTKTGRTVERIIAKMSKSLRNVVNPEEVIGEYGADTLRLFLMFMGPLDASKAWDSKAITGVHRFLKRAFNCFDGHVRRGLTEAESPAATRERHRLIKRVTEDTEGFDFNTAISGFMEFLNATSMETLSRGSLEAFAVLLSPYAPHLAEEAWAMIGNAPCVALQPWPSFDPALLKEETAEVVIQVNGKKRATVDVPLTVTEDGIKAEVAKALEGTAYALTAADRLITVYQRGTKVPRLVNIVKKG